MVINPNQNWGKSHTIIQPLRGFNLILRISMNIIETLWRFSESTYKKGLSLPFKNHCWIVSALQKGETSRTGIQNINHKVHKEHKGNFKSLNAKC